MNQSRTFYKYEDFKVGDYVCVYHPSVIDWENPRKNIYIIKNLKTKWVYCVELNKKCTDKKDKDANIIHTDFLEIVEQKTKKAHYIIWWAFLLSGTLAKGQHIYWKRKIK